MRNRISQFPNEVIDQIKYYVYRLIDPRNGETFYVGKGKGNRVFNHMKCVNALEDFNDVNYKLQTIREIHTAGLEVIHVIHRHGMDEKTALEVEAALIDAYPSATNILGGNGSSEYGPMNAFEIINKYAVDEAIFKHKVIMITINKSLGNRSTYDATRYAWRLSRERAEKAEYVLGTVQGIIVGVYKPEVWLPASIENFPELHMDSPDRLAFVGREANESIKEMYLRKRVPSTYRKKGASNPIKYNF